MAMGHRPVLLGEMLAAARPADGEIVVDATFGGGGYARALLEAADCRVIGLDRDPDAVERGAELQRMFQGRLEVRLGRFAEIERLVGEPVDAVVMDIGVSSFQLDEAGRGFSFQADGELDMRMGREGPTAADAVQHLSEGALAELIRNWGEDDEARAIARAIVQARAARPVTSTAALAALIERALGGRRGARIHPATKTFQALRILVNDELGELAAALSGAERILRPGGRLVVVSFHSLEDRMVKHFLAERSGAGPGGSRYKPEPPPGPDPSFQVTVRKPVTPSPAEAAFNPRARSASLRQGVRTAAPAWPRLPAPEGAAKARAEWERL